MWKKICLLVVIVTSVQSFPSGGYEDHVIDGPSSLPDLSTLKIAGPPKLIRLIVTVDSEVLRFYSRQDINVNNAIMSVMHYANEYAYQLNIRLVLIEIRQMTGYNLSLADFSEWYGEQTELLPHDVAILFRLRYQYGVSSIASLCSNAPIAVSGVWPESAQESGFFLLHQLLHVIGLGHDTKMSCDCPKGERYCLQIKGFTHCSAQAAVELLRVNKCLKTPSPEFSNYSMPICGNGIKEHGEDCDCGPQRNCKDILCDARICRLSIERKYLLLLAVGLSILIFVCTLGVIWTVCIHIKTWTSSTSSSSESTPHKKMSVQLHGDSLPACFAKKSSEDSTLRLLPENQPTKKTATIILPKLRSHKPAKLDLDTELPYMENKKTPEYVINPATLIIPDLNRLPNILHNHRTKSLPRTQPTVNNHPYVEPPIENIPLKVMTKPSVRILTFN